MFEKVGGSLEQYMNLLASRQKLVASNIANAETPGYKAKDIDFRAEFARQVSDGGPTVHELDDLPVKTDGNNVSLDREARLLAENAMRFGIASTLVKGEVKALKLALSEGRSE